MFRFTSYLESKQLIIPPSIVSVQCRMKGFLKGLVLDASWRKNVKNSFNWNSLLYYCITYKFVYSLGNCDKSKWVSSFSTIWKYTNYLGKQSSTITITITNLDTAANTFKGEVEQSNSGTKFFRITGTIKDDCTGFIDLAPYGPVPPFTFDSTNCKFTFTGLAFSGRGLPGKPC